MNESSIDMGIGKIANPSLIFVRKFRWTLSAPGLCEYFMNTCKFDLKSRRLSFSFFEAMGDAEQYYLANCEWLKKPKGPLTFTTWDGCGSPLYEYKFNRPKVTGIWSDFNYAISDVSLKNVDIRFKNHEFRMLLQEPKEQEKTTLTEVPKGKFEKKEIEINHLNAKFFMPGK